VNGSKLGTSKLSDLEHLKQGKAGSSLETRRDSQNFELMDDFALMERLAMTEALTESGMATTQTVSVSQEVDSKAPVDSTRQRQVLDLEESLAAKERELGEANEVCQDLKTKLAAAETQIATLQSRNTANETSLINLQDQLDRLNEAHQEQEKSGSLISHVRTSSNSRGLSGYTIKDILVRARSKSGQTAVASDASSSEGEAHHGEHAACVSDAESKVRGSVHK
jgi:septal ring factor EnvC (AmiA/AmiB activator)